MARKETTWYVRWASYSALSEWAANTAYSVGTLVRPTGTTTQRVFVCVVAGISNATTEPTWTTGWGGSNTDGTVTWREVSGLPAINGDMTNTITWTAYKAATASPTVGQIIQNDAGTHLFIVNVASAFSASEPSWDTTTGNSTVSSGTTWICLGATSAYSAWQGAAPHLSVVFNSIYWANAAYGQRVYVAEDHSVTYSASANIYCNTDQSDPTYVICVDHAGSVPPVAVDVTTGAIEACSNSGGVIGWYSGAGGLWVHGLTFLATGTSIARWQDRGAGVRTSCTYKTTNGAKSGTSMNLDNSNIRFHDCTFEFAVTGEYIALNAAGQNFYDCAFAPTGAVPTKLIVASTGTVSKFIGCDFSAFGSGKTLIGYTSATTAMVHVERCLLGASVTKIQSGFGSGARIDFLNCDTAAGNTNYQFDRSALGGDLTIETTCVRTGGATDGTQAYSWKIVTNANASLMAYFCCPPMLVWNEVTGSSINVEVYGYWSGGAVPTEDDIFMEIEYFGSSGSPMATVVSGFKATPLTAASSHSSDGSSWGAGGTTKFKMIKAITPQKKGFISVRVHCAAPSETFYIDPKVFLS